MKPSIGRILTLRFARILAAALASIAGVALAGAALAFDTGPHFDITEDVLKSEGFSPTAIATAQSANFLVDFYEFIGNPKLTSILDPACRKAVERVLVNGDAQHFDDLDSTRDVAQKWDAMLANTQSTAAAKAKAGDLLGLMALLGMSLHNVQDFYAHSNWVEGGTTGPPLGKGALAKYGDHPTWLSVDRADREAMDVYTRRERGVPKRTHGDWDSNADALNKDWEGRPHHSDAYICAWFASRQWVRLFKDFVADPAVWGRMQAFSRSTFDPSRDWDYARKISFYGGHWNGNGGPTSLGSAFSARTAATSPDLLANAVLNYMYGRCLTTKPGALRTEAEKLLLSWGAMPYKGPVNPTLPSPAPETMQFVRLQVHRIDNINGDDGFGGGEMDWYSRAAIDGQRYWSGLIDEHNNFDFDKSPYAPWTMTKAVTSSTPEVPIIFQLMELDYSDDDQVDVNPRSGAQSLVLRYSLTGGTLRGDVTGPAAFTVEGKGDCDCARLKMSVDRLSGSCLK